MEDSNEKLCFINDMPAMMGRVPSIPLGEPVEVLAGKISDPRPINHSHKFLYLHLQRN